MSTHTLFRAAGAATMLGAVLFVVGVATGTPPPNTAALPQVLVVAFAALLLASLPALYLRQREEAGVLGFIGTALVFVSILLLAGLNYLLAFFAPALADAAPEVLEAFPGGPWQQLMAVNAAARVGLGIGLLLFGIATYRAAVLPRWSAVLAILGGIGPLVQIVVVLGDLPEPIGMAVLLFPIALVGLGWALWSSVGASRPHRAPVAGGLLALLLLTTATPAVAAPPTVEEIEATFTSDFPNPCTDEGFTVTITGIQHTHEVATASGRSLDRLRQSVVVTTSDGFSGRATVGILLAETGSGGTFVGHETFRLAMNDADGQRVVATVALHATTVDGHTRAEVERFALRCVGRR